MGGNATPRPRYRLLFAIDSLAGGGSERVMAELANCLDPERFQIQIVLTLGTNNAQDVEQHVALVQLTRRPPLRLTPAGQSYTTRILEYAFATSLLPFAEPPPMGVRGWYAIVHSLRNHLRTERLQAALLGRHIRAWSPHCVLSFLPNTNALTLLAKAWYRFESPVVCSDRNFLSREIDTLPWSILHRRFVRSYYATANLHVAVSEAAGDDLHQHFGVPRELITTIPNGVNNGLLQRLAGAGTPAGPLAAAASVRIVAAGRLQAQKGFDLLLQALAQTGGIPWQLLLLGSGPDEARLKSLAQELGIGARVHFLGWDSNPYRWMGGCDLFVLSSRWEGMPNAMLEAMALGLPVVAFDCPSGPSEILAAGSYGVLVQPESPAALSAALKALLISPETRQRYGELALRRARDFSLDTMVARYERMLIGLIERDSVRPARHDLPAAQCVANPMHRDGAVNLVDGGQHTHDPGHAEALRLVERKRAIVPRTP
jgi:glycosyltransferase involved in cell wall biosynthesis